jgi:hypothetical protein
MPPNTVRSGLPVIAVVIARLMVDGEDRGVRPFLVPMSDGSKMCTGVTSKCVLGQLNCFPLELTTPVIQSISNSSGCKSN